MATKSEVDVLAALIRDVPDFPKKGILFKDITTLWRAWRTEGDEGTPHDCCTTC
jgi:hypothetical protein